MTSVRYAGPHDVPEILELMRAMHAESRYCRIPFAEDKVLATIAGLIAGPTALVAVAEDREGLAGVMGAIVYEFMFGHATFADELVLYVLPRARGSWAAAKLVGLYVEWAATQGVLEIRSGDSANIDPAKVGDFYTRLGFHPAGTVSSFMRFDHVRH